MIVVHGERTRALHRVLVMIGVGKQKPCRAIGQRCLANAGRSAEQPGMRKPAASIRVEQHTFGFPVTVERGSRTRSFRLDIRGLFFAHEARPASANGAVAGESRSFTVFQIRSATASFRPVASIIMQRPGSASTS